MSTPERTQKILRALRANNGRFCGVTFTKKNGETRRMLCIFSRAKTEASRFTFNPAEKGLVAVWDVQKGAIRFINCNAPVELRAGGKALTL